jgi:hypothetical protein
MNTWDSKLASCDISATESAEESGEASCQVTLGESAVGGLVARDFGKGEGIHKGRIDSVKRVGGHFLYHVLYDDGDSEDFSEGEYVYALDFRKEIENDRDGGVTTSGKETVSSRRTSAVQVKEDRQLNAKSKTKNTAKVSSRKKIASSQMESSGTCSNEKEGAESENSDDNICSSSLRTRSSARVSQRESDRMHQRERRLKALKKPSRKRRLRPINASGSSSSSSKSKLSGSESEAVLESPRESSSSRQPRASPRKKANRLNRNESNVRNGNSPLSNRTTTTRTERERHDVVIIIESDADNMSDNMDNVDHKDTSSSHSDHNSDHSCDSLLTSPYRKEPLCVSNVWVDPIELARACGVSGTISLSSWLEYLLSDEMEERVLAVDPKLLHEALGRRGGGGPLSLILTKERELKKRCALLTSTKDWKQRMKKHGSWYDNVAPGDFTLRMLLQKWLSKIDVGHMDLRGYWTDFGLIRQYNKLVDRLKRDPKDLHDIQSSDEEIWDSEHELHIVNDGEVETDDDDDDNRKKAPHPSFHLEEMKRLRDLQYEDANIQAMVQRAKDRAMEESEVESSGQDEAVEDDLDRAERKLREQKSSSKKRKSNSKRSKKSPFKGKGMRLFGSESDSSSDDDDGEHPKQKGRNGNETTVECAICLETIKKVFSDPHLHL